MYIGAQATECQFGMILGHHTVSLLIMEMDQSILVLGRTLCDLELDISTPSF